MSYKKYDYLGYRHIARWYHGQETAPRECGGHFARTAEHIGDTSRECLKCDGCLHVTHRYWEISGTGFAAPDEKPSVPISDRKLHVELEHVLNIFAKKIMSEEYDPDETVSIDLQEIKNLIVHLQNYIEYKEQKQNKEQKQIDMLEKQIANVKKMQEQTNKEIANLEKKLAEIRRE